MSTGFSVAQIVQALASVCDGARSRDGRGFSRSHAHTGARLAAMSKNRIPWSADDLRAAKALLSEYSNQAGKFYSPNDEAKARNIAKLFRSGSLPPGNETREGRGECPYAVMSPGMRYAYVYLEGEVKGFNEIVALLASQRQLQHGERAVRASLSDPISYHVNGKPKKGRRWELSFNSTTQPALLQLEAEFNVAVDPSLTRPVDKTHDNLIRHKKAAWLEKVSSQNGVKWAVVLDLERKDQLFSNDMKSLLAGKFQCDPRNDWNWSVPFNRSTAPAISHILNKHHFHYCPRIQNILHRETGENHSVRQAAR